MFNDTSKHSVVCRGEKTLDSGRTNIVKHTVFVLGVDGSPLTPTSRAKARKLLRGGVSSPPQGKPCGSRRT